ncbi:MAG: oligopeptide/dipeptide ABC transporter ATP-binding protein [Actinomycetota bacterium]
MTPAIRVEGLSRVFPGRSGEGDVYALTDATFEVARGETLGLVGESGCGKSTLARLLARLDKPTAGRIEVNGTDVTGLSDRAFRSHRGDIQMVFQDPFGSLNPRQTVGRTIGEVLDVHGLVDGRQEREDRINELLTMVGLGTGFASRLPRQLSGGQMQRVGIARALAVEPSILVLDESVSALDVSVQAEVMNLLVRMRDELDLTYVFISHDLGMVRHISDRIAVMYLGRVVELGTWKDVSDHPLHPYAIALQHAVPVADPALESGEIEAPLEGEVPNPADPPSGCAFHPRCPLKEDVCSERRPELVAVDDGRLVACHVVASYQGGGMLGEASDEES